MPRKHLIDSDFDAAYVSRLKHHIERLAEGDEDLVLDLSKAGRVDGSGLGALAFLHKRLVSKGHRLRVVGLSGQPLQMFTDLRLISVLCD